MVDIDAAARRISERLGPYSGLNEGARSWRDLNDEEREELRRVIAASPLANFGTRLPLRDRRCGHPL
jgi:hypothetical protein